MKGMRTHLALIGLVCLLIALFYVRVSGAWFCAYDDFNEAHRAAFSDARNPVRIFTTTHLRDYMYRPVTSGLQYVTWRYFNHSPLAFRLRNLLMHLVAVSMLYGIVILLGGSATAATGAALLFGLHPLANETVVVAIWTNATAYALFFSALFLFLYSLRALRTKGRWGASLTGALACAFVALFTYEPTVVVFGMMLCYLGVERARGLRLPRTYVTAVAAGIALELVFFFVARHLVVTHAAPLNPPSILARNALMYAAALLLPVDFVLGHALFGTPLPSDVRFTGTALAIAGGIGFAIVALALFAFRNSVVRARLSKADWPIMLFLLAGIPLGVLPLLLFREHASEHDLYPSAGFLCAFLALAARRLATRKVLWAAAASLLALLSAGTWVRNERVVECAAVAHRIITQLPVKRWRTGRWHVELATAPGSHLGVPYGIYNDAGLHALEVPKGLTPGAQEAVQLASGNDRVRVEIVPTAQLLRDCVSSETCFLVDSAGNVTPAIPALNARVAR